MIEVFKTNVHQEQAAIELLDLLVKTFPNLEINFDLEDCDKILRVCGCNFRSDDIRKCLERHGFACELLND
jgi:hypothetical protein